MAALIIIKSLNNIGKKADDFPKHPVPFSNYVNYYQCRNINSEPNFTC